MTCEAGKGISTPTRRGFLKWCAVVSAGAFSVLPATFVYAQPHIVVSRGMRRLAGFLKAFAAALAATAVADRFLDFLRTMAWWSDEDDKLEPEAMVLQDAEGRWFITARIIEAEKGRCSRYFRASWDGNVIFLVLVYPLKNDPNNPNRRRLDHINFDVMFQGEGEEGDRALPTAERIGHGRMGVAIGGPQGPLYLRENGFRSKDLLAAVPDACVVMFEIWRGAASHTRQGIDRVIRGADLDDEAVAGRIQAIQERMESLLEEAKEAAGVA